MIAVLLSCLFALVAGGTIVSLGNSVRGWRSALRDLLQERDVLLRQDMRPRTAYRRPRPAAPSAAARSLRDTSRRSLA